MVTLVTTSFAQPALKWQSKQGGNQTDYGRAIDSAADGGIIVAGYNRSTSGAITMKYPNPADPLSPDAWVIKIDRFGNRVWSSQFGGKAHDEFWDVKATSDGGAIAVGETNSTDGDITTAFGGSDMMIVKLDANGNKQWLKTYGTALGGAAKSVALLPDGTYMVAGYTGGNGNIFTGSKGVNDAWLLHLAEDGTVIALKNYGGADADEASDLKVLPNNGGYIITGSTGSRNTGNVTGYHGGTDIWVVKAGMDLNIITAKCFGGTNNETSEAVALMPDGGFLIAGTESSNDLDFVGRRHNGSEAYIIRTDAALEKIWVGTYGSSSSDYFHDVVVKSNGGILGAGEVTAGDGDVTGWLGTGDAWLADIDPANGNLLSQKTYGNALGDRCEDIMIWPNGDILFTGMSAPSDISNGNSEMWVASSKDMAVAGPLPVKLIAFSGSIAGNKNTLTWKTAAEVNTNAFWIERSADGSNFTMIGSIPATGRPGVPQLYSYKDNAPPPAAYYRLRMIDNDGKSELSKVIVLTAGQNNGPSVQAYPTVITSAINVRMVSTASRSTEIVILDVNGHVLKKGIQKLENGINLFSVEVGALPTGIYVLRTVTGNDVYTRRFIKG